MCLKLYITQKSNVRWLAVLVQSGNHTVSGQAKIGFLAYPFSADYFKTKFIYLVNLDYATIVTYKHFRMSSFDYLHILVWKPHMSCISTE